jgi:hypothetical protein
MQGCTCGSNLLVDVDSLTVLVAGLEHHDEVKFKGPSGQFIMVILRQRFRCIVACRSGRFRTVG